MPLMNKPTNNINV